MKNYLLTLAIGVAIIISLNACQKLSNDESGDHVVKSMNDLRISDDFLWETTKDIDVTIDLPENAADYLPVSITNGDGSRVFYTGNPANGSNRLKTHITIPAYLQSLNLSFPKSANQAVIRVPIINNTLFYNLSQGLKEVNIPCDLSGLVTYSQGAWGQPANGHNVGTIRDTYFDTVFPNGLIVGDTANGFTITFTCASAVENFLPAGGVSQMLTQFMVDPANGHLVGNWAGQIIAAMLNVAYNDAGYLGTGNVKLKDVVYINGPFAGMSVKDFLSIANHALGGSQCNYNPIEIGYAAEQICLAFHGHNHNFFTCPNGGGGNGGGNGGGGTPTTTEYHGTLAYEDLWPYKGDYDFNDLIIAYHFNVLKDAQEFVTDIEATFTIKAFGAYFKNGFGFTLPAVSPVDINSVTGYHLKPNSIIQLDNAGLEVGQTKATVIVIDDFFDVMPHPGIGIGVNTEPSAPYVTPVTLVINISFKQGAVSFNQLDIGHFNPFIFIDQSREMEVHLPGYEPTDLADITLLGTGEDAGNQGPEHLYKTQNNLPWAINIPEELDYPIEKVDITGVYHHFAEWAESEGTVYQDWYKDLPGYRNNSLIYTHN